MDTPIDKIDKSDPGDDVTRRFRFQHAYGVSLLVNMTLGNLPYTVLLCEQHEDLLAVTKTGKFVAYQVKTRIPEYGWWKLTNDVFSDCIKKFVNLDQKFPGEVIESFNFVSNTKAYEILAKDTKHLSPHELLIAVKQASCWKNLTDAAAKGFNLLQGKIMMDVPPETLFSVLKRTLIPDIFLSLEGFEDQLALTFIKCLPECASVSGDDLKKICDALIARVAKASSRGSGYDPSRVLAGFPCSDPNLLAKCVTVDDVSNTVLEHLGRKRLAYTRILDLIEKLKKCINNSKDEELAELFDQIYKNNIHYYISHNDLKSLQNNIKKLQEIANERNTESVDIQKQKMHVSLTSSGMNVYLNHIYKFEKWLLDRIFDIAHDINEYITLYIDGQISFKKVIDTICVYCALDELIKRDTIIHKCKIECRTNNVNDPIERVSIYTAYKAVVNLGVLLQSYQALDHKLALSLAEDINMIIAYSNRFSLFILDVEKGDLRQRSLRTR